MNQNKEMNIDNPHVMENQSTYKEYTGKKSLSNKIAIALAIIVSSVVVVFLAIGMIKSHNRAKYKDEFYVQQEVTRYLQERYNEEFIVYYERGMGGAYNYVQLYAYPIAQQDDAHEIKIQGYYNKWGKMDFYDDYVMVKIAKEYEACIDPIIGKYFDEYKFYVEFKSEWLTNNLPASTKLEDLRELSSNIDYPLPTLCIFFGVNEIEGYEGQQILLTMDEIKNIGFRGCVETLFFWDQELYADVTPENNHTVLDGKGNKYEGNVIFIYSDRIEY